MDLKESIELEDHKADLAIRLMERTENFKAVIVAGQSALKSAILINGGAAVALLAFIGHLWKPDISLKPLADPLLWFVIGVLLDALAAGGTYAAQLCYALCDDLHDKLFKAGATIHVLTVLLVAASYLMFAFGICDFYNALVK